MSYIKLRLDEETSRMILDMTDAGRIVREQQQLANQMIESAEEIGSGILAHADSLRTWARTLESHPLFDADAGRVAIDQARADARILDAISRRWGGK